MVRAAVNVVADRSAEAVTRVRNTTSRLFDTLREKSLERDDLRTTNLRVEEWYDGTLKRMTAHVASYQLELVVRDLNQLARLVGLGNCRLAPDRRAPARHG